MPVKVKHKHTGRVTDVPITEWNSVKYLKQNYDVLSQTKIVHVKMKNHAMFGGFQDLGLWEKSDFLLEIQKEPNLYLCEDSPDFFDDNGYLEPTKAPIQYETKIKINQIINKYKNNPWYINIVSGLILSAILYSLGLIINFIIWVDYIKIWVWMKGFYNF